MSTTLPVRDVTLRYWAAAAAAAGTDRESRRGATAGEVLQAARSDHPELGRVLAVATVLLDGTPVREESPLPDGAVLEVLPPFAGG